MAGREKVYLRAVSTERSFTKLKNVSKLLWYMLTKASYDHSTRTLYAPKSKISVAEITTGKAKLYHRRTYYNKLNELQGLTKEGVRDPKKEVLISEGEYNGEPVYFIKNEFSQFALIDTRTISELLKHTREHVLKMYAYTKFLDYAGNKGVSPTTLAENALGYTEITKEAIDLVYSTLEFLNRLGLVEYEVHKLGAGGKLYIAGEQEIEQYGKTHTKRQAHYIEIKEVLNWEDALMSLEDK